MGRAPGTARAALAPPIAEGRGAPLAGMNTLYRRRVLDACAPETLTGGFWETTVHPRLRAKGELLVASDRIRVVHLKRFSLRLFAGQRYADAIEQLEKAMALDPADERIAQYLADVRSAAAAPP